MNKTQPAENKSFNVSLLMRESGRQILTGLGWKPAPGQPLHIHTYKNSDDSLVARLSMGEEHGVVKAFNMAKPEARNWLDREVQISRALKGRGLAPDIRAFSTSHGFVIHSFVKGQTLSDFLSKDNLPLVARRLGAWFRVYNERIPTMATDEKTWGDYLSAYDGIFTDAEMEEFGPFFQSLPIREQGIAKNDAFLDNFLRSDEGRLLGIDYAAARLKPLGWDLLLTARILTQRYPDQVTELVAALMRGWDKDVGGIAPSDFGRLAVIFASATAERKR